MSTNTIASPFADGVLPQQHQSQVVHVRTCLTTWLLATSDIRNKISGSRERLNEATQALINLEVDPAYAFSPAPPYTFRRVLLSCIRCYWLALVSSFDDTERDEMAKRLDVTPPFGKRIPQFNGKRCVEKPGDLTANEYEGLMRTIHLVAQGMAPKDVLKTWRELGEVGVQTWEEQD